MNRVLVCETCNRVFARRDNLLRHRLCKHEARVYTCEICSLKYTRLDNLHRHVKTEHGVSISLPSTVINESCTNLLIAPQQNNSSLIATPPNIKASVYSQSLNEGDDLPTLHAHIGLLVKIFGSFVEMGPNSNSLVHKV